MTKSFSSDDLRQLRDSIAGFNRAFKIGELQTLTRYLDEIRYLQLDSIGTDSETKRLEFGGMINSRLDIRGKFRGEEQKDRVRFALMGVEQLDVVNGVDVNWDSYFDAGLDEDWRVNPPMFPPNISRKFSDGIALEVAERMASALTHSGSHLSDGNTLLAQRIASPNVLKMLSSTGTVTEIEATSYFEVSSITRLLVSYYNNITEGISGLPYVLSSGRGNKKDSKEEAQFDNVEKDILPSQIGTLTINSHDLLCAKKLTCFQIAYSIVSATMEEDNVIDNPMLHIYVVPAEEVDAYISQSDIVISSSEVDFLEVGDTYNGSNVAQYVASTELLSGVINGYVDAVIIGEQTYDISQPSNRDLIIMSLNNDLIGERLYKQYLNRQLNNKIVVMSRASADTLSRFEVIELTGPLSEVCESFVRDELHVRPYFGHLNCPQQRDFTPDVFDYWDHDGLLERVTMEVLLFAISGSPDKKLKDLKAAVSTLLNFIFAKAKGGFGVQYHGDDSGTNNIHGYRSYDIAIYDDGRLYNDEQAYAGMEGTLNAEFDQLQELGLVWTLKLMKELVSPRKITRWHWKARVLIDSLIAINGYGRTEVALSHKSQIEADIAPSNVPMEKHIKSLCNHMVKEAVRNNWLPSEEDFNSTFVSTVKSTSSGATAEGEAVACSITFDDPKSGRERTIHGMGKILYLISNIRYLMDAESYRAANHDVWTESNPGRTGTRNVPGPKAARAIFMADMVYFRGLMPLAQVLDRFQQQVHRTTDSTQYDLFSADLYTVGKESGVPLNDHAAAYKATSDPEVYAAMTDFSTFDATEQWSNFWKPFVEGLLEACEEHGIGDGSDYALIRSSIGNPPLGFSGLIRELLGKFSEPLYFKSEGVLWEQSAMQVAENGMMPSGLLITLSGNNVCNAADFQVFVDEFAGHMSQRAFAIKMMRCMGDDRLVLFQAKNRPSIEEIAGIRALFSEVAESNGMSMNLDKVTFRNCEFEYLKKRGCYGTMVHKAHVMIHANESVNQREDPIEMVRSMDSTLRVWAWRTGSPVYAEKYLLAFAMFKLNFRHDEVADRGKSRRRHTIYPPLSILFVPSVWGGCGHRFRDMYSSSTDGSIFNDYGNDRTFRRFIDIGAKIVNNTYNKDISEIVDAVWRTGVSGGGDSSFDDFKEHLANTRDDFRFHMAGVAEAELEKIGLGSIAERLDYRKMDKAVTERMIASTPPMLDEQYNRLSRRGKIMYERIQKMAPYAKQIANSFEPVRGELPNLGISDAYAWLTKIELRPVGILEPRHDPKEEGSPFNGNCVAPYLALGKAMDVSTTTSKSVVSLKGLIMKLYNDKRMRRDIAIESISEILLQFIHDEDAMFWLLIRMGVLPTYASAVVADVVQNKIAYLAAAAASKLGSFQSDQLLPNLDIGIGAMSRIVVANTIINERSPAYSMLTASVLSRFITDYMKTGHFHTYALVQTRKSLSSDLLRITRGIRSNAPAYNVSDIELMKNATTKTTTSDVRRMLGRQEQEMNRMQRPTYSIPPGNKTFIDDVSIRKPLVDPEHFRSKF